MKRFNYRKWLFDQNLLLEICEKFNVWDLCCLSNENKLINPFTEKFLTLLNFLLNKTLKYDQNDLKKC